LTTSVAGELLATRAPTALDIRILGPLEVLVQGRALPVRGRRQLALLALLVLRAGEVIGSDRLIDDLWGAEPPESGATALQVRVSQLRKTLEQADSHDLIATRAPGYVLQVEPEQIDARRFERMLAEGRALLLEGEPARASALLQEALALWRGPALADLAYENSVQAEIARLEDLRLAALEERLSADLACGRHDRLTSELESLVRAHPLRERLRGQLMLALYRSGRQTDALAAYRDGREALVEELGIEPGPGLRRLEQAILTQDPTLAPPRPVEERAEPSAPRRPPDERKVVTVLFADLVGSTELTTAADPERARALLDRYFDAMAEEIEAAGGTVEKFVGDAVLAVFGAPVAQEDHTERALHVALAMQRRLAELFDGRLEIRIGIATGEVVVAGGRHGGGPFVTGAAVNVSARLEQAAAAGEILVQARSARVAGGAFEFGPSLVVDAKGIPDGIECRRLLRALALTQRGSGGALESALVGREAELETLRSAYRRVAREGRSSLVTVVGDAGVGKSRLVRELWDWLATESPEPLRRTSRCFPAGKRVTYAPLREVLREELGLLASDSPDRARRRLGDREILGLALGLDVAGDLHPLAARERLREAWVDFVRELVADHPVVLLVEDLHWAQDLLLELLEAAVRDVNGPLLVVATARPELLDAHPGFGSDLREAAATLWLEPLSQDEAELLLEQLLEADLPACLREQLVTRAEGSPFFLEELLSRLIDEGAIVRGPSGWELRDAVPELTVPDSIQSVLAARLDLLPPTEKAALQAASVIGRVFWRGPVRELLDGMLPDFAVLEARDFIRRRPASSVAGEREFAFKHALTRDVAYASLPKARRARLHATFADWLERTGAAHDERAPLLAYHYAEAASPEDADLVWAGEPAEEERLRRKAVDWLRHAGELAVKSYDLDDALALFHRALELEPDGCARSALWHSIGRVNALRYDGEPFWTAMLESLGGCQDSAARAEAYSELAFQTAIRSGMWKQNPSSTLVDCWIEQALELAQPGTAARARALLARGFWDVDGAAAAAIEASATAEQLGDPELRSYAWDLRGAVAFASGEHDLGHAFAERRFELLDELTDPDARADIYSTPISGCIWSGRFREARRLARCHDEITEQLTPHHRMHGVATLVEVEELLGAWENVAALAGRVRRAVAANAETPCVRNARSLLVAATASALLGDEHEAAVLEAQAEELGIEGFGHVLDTPRLRLALARNDMEQVEQVLARTPVDRGWYWGWLALSSRVTRFDGLAALRDREQLEREVPERLRPNTYVEPFGLRALGVVREDGALLEQALARFEALGLAWQASETARLLSAGAVRPSR
jgi:DNA-binding SARP family transcriptional activator